MHIFVCVCTGLQYIFLLIQFKIFENQSTKSHSQCVLRPLFTSHHTLSDNTD